MKKLMALIIDLVEEHFWGELVIQFKNGKPINFRKTEVVKLDEEFKEEKKED